MMATPESPEICKLGLSQDIESKVCEARAIHLKSFSCHTTLFAGGSAA